MEEINEEQQLKIVRKKTELAVMVTGFLTALATVMAVAPGGHPPGTVILGTTAIAGAFVTLMITAVRRNFYGFALTAVFLTIIGHIYFTWLLSLLPR